MRPIRPGTLAASVATAVFAVTLAIAPTPAARVREVYDPSLYGFTGPRGCILPSTPPGFRAMAMRARSRAEAESLAWRLGLSGTWERDLYVCLLDGEGALVWSVGPRVAHGVRIPAGPVSALVHREYEPEDPELPMGLWPLRRPGTPRQPPAGEPRIFRCPIALVPSVNRVVREWPPARSENEDIPLLPFGDWIELPELGARARRAPGAGGTQVLVMEPTSADGWAARWLEEHGAGWIGFELPHLDLDATRSRLDSRGLRPRVMNDRAMWLPPSETGGALVVFAAGHGL